MRYSDSDELTGADAKVRDYFRREVVLIYQTNNRGNRADPAKHLSECPDLRTMNLNVYDGTYGCDTGCDYVRYEATVVCPHGFSDEVEIGDFGELTYIVQDILAEEDA
jgi:hypothetical protein